jgi:hypothetical protein
MRILRIPLLCVAAAHVASAQTSDLPPIRRLAPPVATSAKSFRMITSVRGLASGKLLVNDPVAHRLMLGDTTLASFSVVADSAPGGPAEYGRRSGGVIPYLGDSTLFLDASSPAMYMIDPAGKVTRTLAVPAARDAGWMTQSSLSGWPGSDAAGRIIYRGQAPRDQAATKPKVGVWMPFAFPDSAPIQRVDFATRKVEPIAWYKGLKIGGLQYGVTEMRSHSVITSDPLPIVEDFAVFTDGTVAILRGDYHLDVIGADGR